MLVLSRRPDEQILLPTVPAVIKVISANTGLVRLGIEAPTDVPILREELTQTDRGISLTKGSLDSASAASQHQVRNRVNDLILGVTLLRMRMGECNPLVRKTLEAIEEELEALRVAVRTSTGTEQAQPAVANHEPA